MPDHCKRLIAPLHQAMRDFHGDTVQQELHRLCHQDTVFRLSHPLGTCTSVDQFIDTIYTPLLAAIPDLERRNTIVIAGYDQDGAQWLGCAGYYTGVFRAPWLDIPPTGHQVQIRFHEFTRFEDDKIVEIQSLWDIAGIMMQAKAWPMAPSLGREWPAPAPATQDGIVTKPYDAEASARSCAHILAMLDALNRHPKNPDPTVMEMEKFWHANMNWYGPSGVGTSRGIAGFRHWHQIPFLQAMPNRSENMQGTNHHFFADHHYVGVTGWPNMRQTLSADGWMGIAPTNTEITLCSLDFWRLEDGKIRENWVLFDVLDLHAQLGVNVLARMREFNKARIQGQIPPDNGMQPLGGEHAG